MPTPKLIGAGVFMCLQAYCYTLLRQTGVTVHTIHTAVAPGCRVAVVAGHCGTGIRTLGKGWSTERGLGRIVAGRCLVTDDTVPDIRQEVAAIISISQVVAELGFRFERAQIGEYNILDTVEVSRGTGQDTCIFLTIDDAVTVSVTSGTSRIGSVSAVSYGTTVTSEAVDGA